MGAGFLCSAQPASIYRNVCLSVCLSVCADYTKVVEVALTTLRPGWRQVLLYKCTAAHGQFICVAVQLVQAKCVCCTCVRTAFYRVAVILLELFLHPSWLSHFPRPLLTPLGLGLNYCLVPAKNLFLTCCFS